MKLFFSLFASICLHLIGLLLAVPDYRQAGAQVAKKNARVEASIRQSKIQESKTEVSIEISDVSSIGTNPNSENPSDAPEKTIEQQRSPFNFDLYHDRRSLTKQPALIENVDLSPLIEFQEKIQKPPVVELYLSEKGTINWVKISTESDYPPEIQGLITGLLRGLKFSPGEIDGIAVKTIMKIEVLFMPEWSATPPAQTKNDPTDTGR